MTRLSKLERYIHHFGGDSKYYVFERFETPLGVRLKAVTKNGVGFDSCVVAPAAFNEETAHLIAGNRAYASRKLAIAAAKRLYGSSGFEKAITTPFDGDMP